jgi:hypothetical protein
MWKRIAAWWSGLPHGLQAALVGFGGGALGVLEPVIQNWSEGKAVCAVAAAVCVKGYLYSAIKAGVMAIFGLYIRSSYHKATPPNSL